MLAAAAGCGDNFSAVIDSFPIALTRAPLGDGLAGDGALVATGCASPMRPANPSRCWSARGRR